MWVSNTAKDGSGGGTDSLGGDPFSRWLPHGQRGLLLGCPVGHALLLGHLLLHWLLHARVVANLAALHGLCLLLLLLLSPCTQAVTLSFDS